MRFEFATAQRIIFGGGSALDGGKAIAALAVNRGDPLEYLEVIGQGRPLAHRPLPCIAVPTTAGTGSEVTRNAVLASPDHGVKASLRHPWMLPAVPSGSGSGNWRHCSPATLEQTPRMDCGGSRSW
jgi:alcohol dehydrogenase class IV